MARSSTWTAGVSVLLLVLGVNAGIGIEARADEILSVAALGEPQELEVQSLPASGQVSTVERDSYSVRMVGLVEWPVARTSGTSDAWGYRSNLEGMHYGQDFNPGVGSDVYAVTEGTVVSAGGEGNYGNAVRMISVVDGAVVETLYAHMRDGSLTVSAGDVVERGTVLGLVGSTGLSTGPHLHFEVTVDGVRTNPLDWLVAYENVRHGEEWPFR